VYNELSTAALSQQNLISSVRSSSTPGTADNLLQQARDMACYLEAYWVVASERHADNVCKAVRSGVLHALEGKLRPAALALAMDRETAQRVMVEDAAVAQQRAALTDKVERLTKALDTLKRAARA
jgi:uncharacterized iron-regulated protein